MQRHVFVVVGSQDSQVRGKEIDASMAESETEARLCESPDEAAVSPSPLSSYSSSLSCFLLITHKGVGRFSSTCHDVL